MRRSTGIFGAFILLAAACNAPSDPRGTDATLTARAYIDRDGSGTFTAGDSALANVLLSLFADGNQITTQRTGADGTAAFPGLAPGSYSMHAPADAVTGGVLSSSAAPVAAISFQGGVPPVEFRYAFYPGAVSGVVFRDDNNNGTVDATDTKASGLTVYLRRDSSGTAVAIVDSVATATDGTYAFARVAPGSYWVQFQNPTTISYGAAGAQRKVSVNPLAVSTVSATFTGSLAQPLATIRAGTLGTTYTAIGNITVAPGAIPSGTGNVNSEVWMQDATGGISVFAMSTADSLNFVVGDRISVTAPLAVFSGQLELSPNPVVTKLGTGTAPAAKVITGTQMNTKADDGLLVQLNDFTVTIIGGGTGASFNVTGTTSDGATVVVRVSGALTGLSRAVFTVGTTYRVIGVLSQNGGTAQLKVRSRADITP